MKNLTGESMNITEENLKAMQQLFPEAFEEGKIDFDVLRQLLGDFVDDEQERYSFKWNGKGKALRLSQTPSMGTLRPCKEESKDWDNTENLYIEGDNLEVLKLLQKSYYGKVKMIYIDPPYNTGGDFVYKDNFHDNIQNYKEVTGQIDGEGNKIDTNTESNGRFHTDWLNMMYPRLRLARNLLSDDGVIFISIDDNEQENLKRICDDVYGENNFVADLIWANKEGGGSSDSKLFRIKHEHIISYAKNIEGMEIIGTEISNADRYKGEDEYVRIRGKYYLQKLGMGSIQYSKSLDYPIEAPDGSLIMPSDNNNGKRACWRWSKDKFDRNKENGFIEIKKDSSDVWTVYTKQYMCCDNDGNIIVRTQRPMGIIDEYSSTQAAKMLETMNLGKSFSYSKPVDLIKYLIQRIKCSSDFVLDFFSGSATTAHAIMQLNAEDGGHRKFIMVQLPEPTDEKSEAYKAGYQNICEIGKERIRRAGDKIKAEAGDKADDLDIGFKVFKLDSSNLQKWNPQPDDLVMTLQQATDNFLPDRTEQDVLYEIMLKMGLDLTCQIEEEQAAGETVYIIGGGALMICLGRNITTAVAEAVVKLHEEYESELWQVVFRDTGFASDMDKTNVKETLKAAGLDEDSFVCV